MNFFLGFLAGCLFSHLMVIGIAIYVDYVDKKKGSITKW